MCFSHIFAIANQLPGFSISKLANVEDFFLMSVYIYSVYIYIVNILLTRIFKECSIRKSRAYIFIYLSKIKTQRFLRYTVFHVFTQSSDVIIFYTVCYITFHGLTKVQN